MAGFLRPVSFSLILGVYVMGGLCASGFGWLDLVIWLSGKQGRCVELYLMAIVSRSGKHTLNRPWLLLAVVNHMAPFPPAFVVPERALKKEIQK